MISELLTALLEYIILIKRIHKSVNGDGFSPATFQEVKSEEKRVVAYISRYSSGHLIPSVAVAEVGIKFSL